MSAVDILVPSNGVRRVHSLIAERLREKGYDAALVGIDTPDTYGIFDNMLAAERRMLRIRDDDLFDVIPTTQLSQPRHDATLRIDLTASGQAFASPVLEPLFSGCPSVTAAAHLLMRGHLSDISIVLDRKEAVAYAAPMVDSRLLVLRGLNDILARMLTLLVDTADRYSRREIGEGTPFLNLPRPSSARLVSTYFFSMVPRQLKGALERAVFNIHRWKTCYRFHDGARVAGTGRIGGKPWTVLPDDGKRFYADPFPFEWQGRHFIFVEELADTATKAVISVAEVFPDGGATVPRTIIEEPYHLSYPQVFSRDGEIWMLPESAAGGSLVLYRAEVFPDRWERHSVLISDRALFDATLLEHDGCLWLFASEREIYGSASDTLVVYYADTLHGPWTPHRANPLRIDRAAARPGGQFVRVGDRILLPMQDGTAGYGGALGLSELLELNKDRVRLTTPVPISSQDTVVPGIHTLNCNEYLEVVDRKNRLFRWKPRRRPRAR